MGLKEVENRDKADFCIINTCAVTGEAARKSRQAVRRLMKFSPGAKVFAIGCAAEIPEDALVNIPHNVEFLDNKEKENISQIIEKSIEGKQESDLSCSSILKTRENIPIDTGSRTRAFLKVQDGCNSFCSYCIIPYLRGRSRSREPGEVLEEIKKLETAGYREVVLTGIHLGDYGKGLKEKINLAGLLDLLCSDTKIPRIRLSSLEPMDFTFDLFDTMKKHPRICRHLHLPLQHGSRRILELMNRRYTPEEYESIVNRAVECFPDIAITTDVMVGFPGETEEDFKEMYDFIERLPFFSLHCFPYSRRPGTKADSFEGFVPSHVKKDRLQRLITLGKIKTENFLERFINCEVMVLTEKFKESPAKTEYEAPSPGTGGILQGHTDNYLMVHFKGEENLTGKITQVTVKERMGEILYGERFTPVCNR